MVKLFFHPDVFLEIKSSYDWYQEQASGLGEDFINELDYAYQAINFDFTMASNISSLS